MTPLVHRIVRFKDRKGIPMKKHNILKILSLQLFGESAGAAGADGGADAGSEGTGVTAAAAGQPKKGVKQNPLANVIYGKQPQQPEGDASDAGVQQQEPLAQPPDRNAEFEKLIKGDYKEQYDARVQDTVRRRLKSTQETVDRYNELSPTLELLAKKYGVDAGNIKALNKAIQDDDSMFEQEAMRRGMTTEHYKQMLKIERENDALRKQMRAKENRENADRQYAGWLKDAEGVKGMYPQFDIRAELKNPQFVSLLRSNVPMQTAYEVLHRDEIIPAAMQYAAKQVESKMAGKVAASQARPSENGTRSQSAAVHKTDVHKFTRADREEIARRAARGEKIVL